MTRIFNPSARLTRGVRALLLAVLALVPVAAAAAVPGSYRFQSLSEAMEPGWSKTQYDAQIGSVGVAVNNNGNLFGYWAGTDGRLHSYNLVFGSNPRMTVLYTHDFLAASGGDSTCWWIFCSTEMAYGVRIEPASLFAAFVNTPMGTSATPGSLPLMRFPGNFVEENANGTIAATQVGGGTQYGVVIQKNVPIAITDVPWLVAINDNAAPQVLGDIGAEGACFVYGIGCPSQVPIGCIYDPETDTHDNDLGKGHGEHGNGHGYGHYKCDGVPEPASDAAHDAHGGTGDSTDTGTGGSAQFLPANGAVLIQVRADNTTQRYGFAAWLGDGTANAWVARVFPLALNRNTAVLRADLSLGGMIYDRRLVSCRFDPAALDANLDGLVDCIGGLQVVGGNPGIRVTTVMGFSLNDDGQLFGNFGNNASGIGAPFVLNIAAATPQATLLSNVATGAGTWEIHHVSDNNRTGRAVGYGFQDCGTRPRTFLLTPLLAPAGGLQFVYGMFEQDTVHAAGSSIDVRPLLAGGSGNYQYRTFVKTPGDAQWNLLSDWGMTGGSYNAGSYTGDVCFRIEGRDASAPLFVQKEVVRHRLVATLPAINPNADQGPLEVQSTVSASSLSYDPALLAGALAPFALLALVLVGMRRRR